MSVYNKKQRDTSGRISRLLTKNQLNRPRKHASLQHLHFVQIPRHRHKLLLRQIVLGFDSEEMIFNSHPRKPTRHDCCL